MPNKKAAVLHGEFDPFKEETKNKTDDLSNKLNIEIERSKKAENTLNSSINSEKSARESADNNINSRLDQLGFKRGGSATMGNGIISFIKLGKFVIAQITNPDGNMGAGTWNVIPEGYRPHTTITITSKIRTEWGGQVHTSTWVWEFKSNGDVTTSHTGSTSDVRMTSGCTFYFGWSIDGNFWF